MSEAFRSTHVNVSAKSTTTNPLTTMTNAMVATTKYRTAVCAVYHLPAPTWIVCVFARCMIKEKVAKLAARVNFILSSLYCYYDYFIIFVVRY